MTKCRPHGMMMMLFVVTNTMQLGFGCSLRGMNAAAVQVHIIFVKRVLYDLRHDMHTSRASGFGGQQVLHNPVGLRSRLVWQSRQLLSTWFNEGRASSCASAGSCFDLSSIYACLSLSLSLSVSAVYCKTQGCMYVRHIYTIYSQTFSSLRVLPFTLSEGPFYTKAWPIFKLSTV